MNGEGGPTCVCLHNLHTARLARQRLLAVCQQCLVCTEAEGMHRLIWAVDGGLRHSLLQVPNMDEGVLATSGQQPGRQAAQHTAAQAQPSAHDMMLVSERTCAWQECTACPNQEFNRGNHGVYS